MTKIKVLHNQTLFDIAIQYFGTTQAVFDIAILNNISITENLTVGMELQLPEKDYGFNEIVKYFKSNNIKPATKTTEPGTQNDLDYLLPQTLPHI